MSGKLINGDAVSNQCGKEILQVLIKAVHENRDYLSKIDGAIGDGDHGINMNKGFSMARSLLTTNEPLPLGTALIGLGNILLNEIGGSMGPIYGTFFMEMGEAMNSAAEIDSKVFLNMLTAGRKGVQEIGNAQVGDKTLIDTLVPAENALNDSIEHDTGFAEALKRMISGARTGMESTKDMVAKLGRSARLGERSRGVLDAGATSCFIILEAMAFEIEHLLGASE